MKLVRFSTNGQSPRLGTLQGDRIADLQASVAATLTKRGVVRAGEIAAALVPASTRGFLEGGAASQDAVKAITEWVTVPVSSARLHAPIADPGKFICIGLNYRDHAEEAGQAIPKEPPIFGKWANAILDPGEPILRPRGSKALDWEVELGVVIGLGGKNIRREDAMQHVWGYTVINDISARDLQTRHQQFFKGKSLDGSCPMGPCIVTADEIADPHNLALRLRVNGVVKQESTTSDFIFDIPTLIEVLSRGMTLEPGDIIATGTPEGVGFARTPAEFLRPGDLMETEIVGIGVLRNMAVAASDWAQSKG
jgi:2-keto-4-pentenoate hydratase/2-oxohepta-3-ene-1,7-dioic acid hydratase in catechol pathway